MPLEISNADQRILQHAIGLLQSTYPASLPSGRNTDVQGSSIAYLRWAIGMSERLMVNSARLAQYQLVLCKFVYNYPDSARSWFVMDTAFVNAVKGRYPNIGLILDKYLSNMDTLREYRWMLTRHEVAVISLCVPHVTAGATFGILPKSSLISLHETLVAQEAMVSTTPEVSTKSRLAEVRKCYMCGAVKPPKVSCAICGYTPRG